VNGTEGVEFSSSVDAHDEEDISSAVDTAFTTS
jgi:hypothetical protein